MKKFILTHFTSFHQFDFLIVNAESEDKAKELANEKGWEHIDYDIQELDDTPNSVIYTQVYSDEYY
jgi:hypothetical protein